MRAQQPRLRRKQFVVVTAVVIVAGAASAAVATHTLTSSFDPTGIVATRSATGLGSPSNPFFQSLGTNGRSCGTCHVADSAFGLSVRHIDERFAITRGRDPLFADVDGANCPGATRGDRAAHSLLLEHGLIRIAISVPANEITINAVRDPYGCASVVDGVSGQPTISVYRRPLPTTNLRFLSAVMFDGRETLRPLSSAATFADNLIFDLKHQSVSATLGHAQATQPPTPDQQTQIVAFELGLTSAQLFDVAAGVLTLDGAAGGPGALSAQSYYPGINDSLGGDPDGNAFDPNAFSAFEAWSDPPGTPARAAAREAIAAGERIFNTRPLTITGVRGLNDNAALGSPAAITGTCTTCHDTPNVGSHSFPLPLDIGTGHDPASESDPNIAAALAALSLPDLPVFAVDGCGSATILTTDPGKALVTGACSDVNRIKGPILRGLSARAPYFHNGAAHDLHEVVSFYESRFQLSLTAEEETQLIAFLNSL